MPPPAIDTRPLADYAGTWSGSNGVVVSVHASGYMSGGSTRSVPGHNQYTSFNGKFVLDGGTATVRAASFTYHDEHLESSGWVTSSQYGTADITLRQTVPLSGAPVLEIDIANATVPMLAAKDTLTAGRQSLPPPPIPLAYWAGVYKNGLIDPSGAVAWGNVSTCAATGVISDYDPMTSMFLFHGQVEGASCEPFWRTGNFTFVGSASLFQVSPQHVEALTMQVVDGGSPFNIQLVRF